MEEHDRTLALAGGEPDVQQELEHALFEMKRVIVGQERMLERVLVALLANGHLLIDGVPGLAKTLTVRTLADVFGGTFHRIQFTPDLVPSDLVGTRIYRPGNGDFTTELGPVFCNVLLADEINRAPAKVQSALLEVMHVILPQVMHGLAATILIVFIFNWSDLLLAVMLTQDSVRTAPVFLASLEMEGSGILFGLEAALGLILLLPVLGLGLLVRRYLARGLTLGAVR